MRSPHFLRGTRQETPIIDNPVEPYLRILAKSPNLGLPTPEKNCREKCSKKYGISKIKR